MTEHESFAELEQLLRGLPLRQPAAALDGRIGQACRPRPRWLKLLAPIGLAACLLVAVAGVYRGSVAPVATLPVPVAPRAVAGDDGPKRSVRHVAMIASGAGSFLPTITLLHCQLEPAPAGKS